MVNTLVDDGNENLGNVEGRLVAIEGNVENTSKEGSQTNKDFKAIKNCQKQTMMLSRNQLKIAPKY